MTDSLVKTAAAQPADTSNRKAELLSTQVEHIDIRSFDARPIVDAMKKMSFTSRDLGRATDIYNQMLADKDCSIFLVIAGSTSAGGCMDLYAELVRNNMVDGIVATGATIVDMDFFEGLGHKHYQALEVPDDDTLRSLYIDRIYDTYIDEEQLQDCDFTINKIANELPPKAYSSRAFIREMGRYLAEHGKKENSLVKLAYEHDVPIFCPAFVDSSAGFGLVKHQVDNASLAGYRCDLLDDPASLANAIAELQASDVLVAITFWRLFNSTITAARQAKAQGATVCVISDRTKSPVADLADHILVVPAEGTSFFSLDGAGPGCRGRTLR